MNLKEQDKTIDKMLDELLMQVEYLNGHLKATEDEVRRAHMAADLSRKMLEKSAGIYNLVKQRAEVVQFFHSKQN